MKLFIIILHDLEFILERIYIRQTLVLIPLIILIFTVQCKKNGDQDNQDIIYSWPDSLPGKLLVCLPDGIYTYDSDSLTQLTWGYNYYNARWSPDDSKIICLKGVGYQQTPEIYTLNGDGTGLHSLNIYGNYACWSPDGTKILYTRNTLDFPEYWVIDCSGENNRFLGKYPGWDPDWSPDGNDIILNGPTSSDYGCGIYQLILTDSTITRITDGMESDAKFSPDGKKIVYIHVNDSIFNPTDLFVMNSDGTDKINLTNFSTVQQKAKSPAWSPDGTMIAFKIGITDYDEVYVINSDGSGLTRVGLSIQSDLDWSNTIK